ncbi:MAG: single-stranded DNA-binding protein [Firmicutes bacterium]|nr:single-stranded DNA-binding protein [Bacillota bacterium]
MNVVVLIGRLARDPELRYIPESQMAVCTFTLAIDRFASGERKTDWPRITVFGKQAENCAKFLTKGRQAAVEGRIQTGSYQNKNGDTVYTTEIVANRVEFIGSKNDAEPGGFARPQQSMDGGMGSMGGMNMASQPTSMPEGIPEGFEAIDDDDIPF